MNIFLNDYNDLCHDKVYEDLKNLATKGTFGYGADQYTKKTKELIKKELNKDDVDIEFIAGGTIANILALSANILPYESIIAASTGHIVGHEAASIEATGHKVELIETKDGKLTEDLLAKKLEEFSEEYHTVPKMVYISQTTELGTVYSYVEIEDLYNLCLERGLYLYIDGARMAQGLAASDIEIQDLPNICDIFTLGGTKNGAMYGEVLVIVEDELKDRFRNYMKQRGAVMAKTFIMSSQFESLFKDGLYYELGKKAYEMAKILAKGLEEKGIKFFAKPQSNQIFIIYPIDRIESLAKENSFEIMPYTNTEKIIRFVTNYRTSLDEIEALLKII